MTTTAGPAPQAHGSSLVWILLSGALALGVMWSLPDLHAGLSWLAAITVLTFLLFGWDKLAALRGRRRTPERELLLVCLLGGSLGGLVAMSLFRHKTTKSSFRWRYWSVVGLQVAGLAAWLWHTGGG